MDVALFLYLADEFDPSLEDLFATFAFFLYIADVVCLSRYDLFATFAFRLLPRTLPMGSSSCASTRSALFERRARAAAARRCLAFRSSLVPRSFVAFFRPRASRAD